VQLSGTSAGAATAQSIASTSEYLHITHPTPMQQRPSQREWHGNFRIH